MAPCEPVNHSPTHYSPLTHFHRNKKMAKNLTAQIKLQCPGGQATPAPPVGPALGQHGVNIGAFVSQFNDKPKDARGVTVPVVIPVYCDRFFPIEVKRPRDASLLK